jgi:hypothetical protein
MITAVEIEDWMPKTCNECRESHVMYSLLQHNYILTYCEQSGKTLTNVKDTTIQRPADCPLTAG